MITICAKCKYWGDDGDSRPLRYCYAGPTVKEYFDYETGRTVRVVEPSRRNLQNQGNCELYEPTRWERLKQAIRRLLPWTN